MVSRIYIYIEVGMDFLFRSMASALYCDVTHGMMLQNWTHVYMDLHVLKSNVIFFLNVQQTFILILTLGVSKSKSS